MTELDAKEPITEYELDEWSDSDRTELTEALTEAGIAHRWESTVLLVASATESDVDELLDDFESDGIENGESEVTENGDGKNSARGEVLSQLFLSAQRIARDPLDSNGLSMLVSVLEEVEGASAPYGIGDSVWRQIVDLASQIEDALTGGEQPDEVTAMDLAGRLFAILRSHV
ncbi:MAG: hypothetical protein HQ486_07280 [Acidimicrobiaceae bacterium]|nr:hypothetical protein [Acidimicrobiaceae bacterium]